MKKIIEGKRYNTETAKEIASDGNGLSFSDFRHWDETLYKTKNGTWFLHGEGGPMTKYAESGDGNYTNGSENIVLLTESEAYEWCEEHGQVEAIEKHFAHVITEG